MDDLNLLYNDIDLKSNNTDWFKLSIILGKTSSKLQSKSVSPQHIIEIIKFIFVIGQKYEIDLNLAWSKWTKKALVKQYKLNNIIL